MAVPHPQSGPPPHRGSQPPLAHPSTLNYSNLPPAHTEKVRSALPLPGAFWVGALGGTFLALSGASLVKGPFVRSDELAFLGSLVVNAAWTATFCTVPFGLT